ncbi:MAG: hypothetical protein EPN97_18845 [Alphaproteobacteria bacterium]|nr:MAG: hypothetical protein EPN97_18845 [Alphaproteobacteria bacterium]
MFKLLGRIDIDGTKASIDKCALIASIPSGTIKQIGLKRKVPIVDAWLYASPWYRFHLDTMDDEIRDFLTAHSRVGDALAARDAGIAYAFFTLCPVETKDEGSFAGIFSLETLKLLASMGLELQISPATVMPDSPYWKR